MKTEGKIKVGDIVRRKLKQGVFVGSYKVVDEVEQYGVYAHDIPQNALGSMYYKSGTLEKIPQLHLKAPNKELRDVIKENLTWIQHVECSSWRKAIEEKAEIIMIASNSSHIIVSEPKARIVFYKGRYCVNINFIRILEHVIR